MAEIWSSSFEIHFDVVQKHLPLLDPAKFWHLANHIDIHHQHLALKYAVGMSGASSARTSTLLEEQYYMSARHHVDKAEAQADGASCWNIETVQTLILIARYEFTKAVPARALLTMSRLMRLIGLLGYDRVDRQSKENDINPRSYFALKMDPPVESEEARRVFWIAFSMDCHAHTYAGSPETIETIEVRKFNSFSLFSCQLSAC